MRSLCRLCLFVLAALFSAGCARNIVFLPTETAGRPTPVSPGVDRSAVVVETEGRVEARAAVSGPWQDAGGGVSLTEGGQIRTRPGGRALVGLTEGSKIRMGPDTLFTFTVLNPYLDSLLTSLALEGGQVWVLLNGGALDVETPLGIASARSAYLGVNYDAQAGTVDVSCLQGTCSFGTADAAVFIPPGHILRHAEDNNTPEPMSMADFGDWGANVAEATQLAFYATEALMQGGATLPVLPTDTPTPEPPTATLAPSQPSPTQPAPTSTPSPGPTPLPTATSRPFTPIPPAPIIGQHLVGGGETIYCIARVYGVLPAAIAQANGLSSPFTVFPGQLLQIPQVRWTPTVLPGQVCAPQFVSPFPGLPFATSTPPATSTSPAAQLSLSLSLQCIFNCGSQEGEYILRIEALASGGAPPYTYIPAQTSELSFPHCVDGSGTVTVTSADGQAVSANWSFHDVSCPPPASATPPPPASATAAPPGPSATPTLPPPTATDTPLP